MTIFACMLFIFTVVGAVIWIIQGMVLWQAVVIAALWVLLLLWCVLDVGARADMHDDSRHRPWEGDGDN